MNINSLFPGRNKTICCRDCLSRNSMRQCIFVALVSLYDALTPPLPTSLLIKLHKLSVLRSLLPALQPHCSAVYFLSISGCRVVGYTWSIPDSVMSLTLIAAGSSVPDAIASLIVVREGTAFVLLLSCNVSK